MSTDTLPPESAPTIAEWVSQLPESLRPFAEEIETLYRELPRLLAEEGENLYAVIRGREVYGVWDTRRDASQYGHEKFDDGRFLTQKIEAKLLPVLTNMIGRPDGVA